MAALTKTASVTLKALATVATGTIEVGSAQDVSTKFAVGIAIRLGRTIATALTTPARFRIEGSPETSGDGSAGKWFPLAVIESGFALVEAEAVTGTVNAGQPVVTMAATANLAYNDFVFILNGTVTAPSTIPSSSASSPSWRTPRSRWRRTWSTPRRAPLSTTVWMVSLVTPAVCSRSMTTPPLTAITYDNALAIIALLGRGTRDDLARARLLGDSFLYAQDHDPNYADGRLRQGYWVGPFTLPFTSNDAYFVRDDGTVNLVLAPWYFLGSSVGDMSWSGIALAKLYAKTRQRRYLDGALRRAHWIVDNAYDTVGLGGYSFGVDNDNHRISHIKSSEHNIDVYALFNNLLWPLTRDSSWKDLGRHALEFIQRLWNPDGGFFWAGSGDGVTINKDVVAEDVQSWSFLALRDQRYAVALDWAKTNLATTDTPQSLNSRLTGNLRLSGVTFSSASRSAIVPPSVFDPPPDPDAVWFEGTSQQAAALLARRWVFTDLPTSHGDLATAAEHLSQAELDQAELSRGQTVNGIAIPDGMGVTATSGVLNTGFGFSYFPVLHIGATSWF